MLRWGDLGQLGVLLLSLALPLQGFAFQSERHAFVATEPEELLANSRWDSEASSDLINYLRPHDWEASWGLKNKAFDLTLGSISGKQFLYHQRLKVFHPLTERLEVRIQWIQDRDFEQDRTALPLELKAKINTKFSASIMGQPSLYKAENDIGASLYFTPSETSEYRFSFVRGDFNRNQRNLELDQWQKNPESFTLSRRHLNPSDGGYNYLEVHFEPKSVRSLNNVRVRSLENHSFQYSGSEPLSGARKLNWRVLLDRARDEDHDNQIKYRRDRWLNQAQYEFRKGPHIFRPGLNVFVRENYVNQNQQTTFEVLPTFWMDLPTRSVSVGTHTWSFGYDATAFFRNRGEFNDRDLEHRLNIKSITRFSQAGELAFLFTFDLDRFGTGESWEGGAGQFLLYF